MISLNDLEWAAGFLDGEGCVQFSKHKHLNLTAAQVEKEPVDRLIGLFGGAVYSYPPKRPNENLAHRWHAVHARAAGIMMTLYPLLSPKRQEAIRLALDKWKQIIPQEYRTHCPKGHELSGDNLYVSRGKRYCHECRTYKAQVEAGWRTPKWENRRPGETENFRCKNGHPYEGDNIYVWNGKRYCRACRTHKRAVSIGWKKKPEVVENVL